MQPIHVGPIHFRVVRAREEEIVRSALQQNRPVLVVTPAVDAPTLQEWAMAQGIPCTRVQRLAEARGFYEERAKPRGPHLFLVNASAYMQLFRIFVADAIHLAPQAVLNKPGYDWLHLDLGCKHHPLEAFPPVEAKGAEWIRTFTTLEEHLNATCATKKHCSGCLGNAIIPIDWFRESHLRGCGLLREARSWLRRWVEWSDRLLSPGALTALLQGSTLQELYSALQPGVAVPAFRVVLHEVCIPAGLVREEDGRYHLTLLGEVASLAPGDWSDALFAGGERVPPDLLDTEADHRYLSYRLWATVVALAGGEAIPDQLAVDLSEVVDNARPADATVNPDLRDWLQQANEATPALRSAPLGLLALAVPRRVGLAGRYLRTYPVNGDLYAEFLLEALPACPAIGLGLTCRPEALLAKHSRMQEGVDRLVANPRSLNTALRMLDAWNDSNDAYRKVRGRWLKAWLERHGAAWFRETPAPQLLNECRPAWAGAPGSDLWLALEDAVGGALAYRLTAGTPDLPTNVELLQEELTAIRAAGKRLILIILDGLGWLIWTGIGTRLPLGAQLRARPALVGMPTTTKERMPEVAGLVAADQPESYWTLFRSPEPEEEDAAGIMARAGTLHTVNRYLDLLDHLATLPAGSGTVTIYVTVGDRVCTGEGISPETVYSEVVDNLLRVLTPRLAESVLIITADHGLTPTVQDPRLVARIKETWGLSGLESNRLVRTEARGNWTAADERRPGLPIAWRDRVFVSFPPGFRRDGGHGLAYTHGGFSAGESYVPVAVVWREDS